MRVGSIATVAASLALAAALVPARAGAAPKKARPTVAVLYFDYTGKNAELEPLRKGLSRMLISDLAAAPAFQIVERERLEEVLAELKLARSKRIDPASAAKLGRLLGARYLVLGGYFELGGALRVDARVVEVETGAVLKAMGAQRKTEDFLALEQKLAEDLGAALTAAVGTAAAPPPTAKPKARPAPPKRLKATLAARYGKALDAKDRGDLKQARTELRAVVKAQPDFALAVADLAALAK